MVGPRLLRRHATQACGSIDSTFESTPTSGRPIILTIHQYILVEIGMWCAKNILISIVARAPAVGGVIALQSVDGLVIAGKKYTARCPNLPGEVSEKSPVVSTASSSPIAYDISSCNVSKTHNYFRKIGKKYFAVCF